MNVGRIKCVPCGNRPFKDKEALEQHLKTSSQYHPLCERCDKRFSSETGLQAHLDAKHPPTYDCIPCARSFKEQGHLEAHFRGSPNHPNCARCGKGFADAEDLQLHRKTAHVQAPCAPCGGELVYQDVDSLDRHYTASSGHPKCPTCGKGVVDQAALELHIVSHTIAAESNVDETSSERAELGVETTVPARFPLEEETSPSTVRPSRPAWPPIASSDSFVKDIPPRAPAASVIFNAPPPHIPAIPRSPTAPALPTLRHHIMAKNTAFASEQSTGFTPLTPKPNSSLLTLNTFGATRTDTPELRLRMGFSSPLMSVQPPPFSPTASNLPPPGREVDQLWNSKQNVQLSPTRGLGVQPFTGPARPASPARSVASSGTELSPSRERYSNRASPPSVPGPSLAFGSINGHVSRRSEGSFLPRSSLSGPSPQIPLGDRRVYGGLARTNISPSALNNTGNVSPQGRHHPSLSEERPRQREALWRKDAVDANAFRTTYDRLMPDASPTRSGFGGDTPKIARSPKEGTNVSVVATDTSSESEGSGATSGSPSSLSSMSLNDPLTPAAETVLAPPFELQPKAARPPIGGFGTAPGLELSSSFDRSLPVAGNSPMILSKASSPSPLADTSLDLNVNFTWPDSKLPIQDSPTSVAAPAALDKPLQTPESEQNEIVDESQLTTDDLINDTTPDDLISLPSSPKKDETCAPSPEVRSLNESPECNGPPSEDESETTDVDDTQPSVLKLDDSLSPTKDTVELPLLHCRECKAHSCDDITATMCGHVFCNKCIVNAVMKNSCCPVCSTPTLLYCLFRLKL